MELIEEFEAFYGEERVRTNYPMESGQRPDLVVLEQEGEPLLVVESKSSSDTASTWEAFSHIRDYSAYAESLFIGYLTPKIRYIFKSCELASENIEFQISVGSLPEDSKDLNNRRGFQSYEELEFCADYARQICRNKSSYAPSIDDVLQELQRLTVAEKINQEITPYNEGFVDQLQQVDSKISNQYPFYSSSYSEKDLRASRIIQGVLNGYSVAETDDDILERFVSEVTSRIEESSQHGTPTGSARYIIDQINVESGHKILDPAMGWGNILRELSQIEQGADYQGIELAPEIAGTASALNTLLNNDISIEIGDGINKVFDDRSMQSSFDHVVLDPPIGKLLSAEDLPQEMKEWEGSNIEDVFVYSAIEYVKNDGLLTAIVPLDMLGRKKSKELREELINRFQVETVIEVAEGSFYPKISADLAVIQLRKSSSPGEHSTEFLILEEFDGTSEEYIDPEIKNRLELSLSPDSSKQSLIPSKILAERDIDDQLNNSYSGLIELKKVASHIRKGTRIPSKQLWQEGDLQYLQISDVTGKSDAANFVSESETEEVAKAGPTDLLISSAGSVDVTYVPDECVAPHSNWAIVRFNSELLANVYHGFFCTELGTKLLKSRSKGTTIPHLTVEDLEELPVPEFGEERLTDIMAELDDIEGWPEGRVDGQTANLIENILRQVR